MKRQLPSTKPCLICNNRPRYLRNSYCRECTFERSKIFRRKKRGIIDPVSDLENEIWLDVVGFEGVYAVSNYGRAKSLRRINKRGSLNQERLMKQTISNWGYHRVSLFKGRKYISPCIHVLVAKAFLPNPENKPEVNHIDGDKLNNKLENLEWVTLSENSQHALRTGLFKQIGEKCFLAKLTDYQAIEIYKSTKSVKELSVEYKVTEGAIYHIRSGFSWKQVTAHLRKPQENEKNAAVN